MTVADLKSGDRFQVTRSQFIDIYEWVEHFGCWGCALRVWPTRGENDEVFVNEMEVTLVTELPDNDTKGTP